jgi:hypothetical protein
MLPAASAPMSVTPDVPAGVADRMLWRTADRLRRDHQPGSSGRCVCCELVFPCLGRWLGETGAHLAENGALPLPRRRPSPRPSPPSPALPAGRWSPW